MDEIIQLVEESKERVKGYIYDFPHAFDSTNVRQLAGYLEEEAAKLRAIADVDMKLKGL